MKHGWGGMNGLVNLGLSRPRLGTLDSIGTGLDKIGGVGAAYYAAGTWKAGAGLSGIIDRARVEGIGASGALSAIPAAGARALSSSASGSSLHRGPPATPPRPTA